MTRFPPAEATITVRCPTIGLDKENDAVGSVLPGTTVTYTLTLTVTDGPAEDVMVVDLLPEGLDDPDEHQRRRCVRPADAHDHLGFGRPRRPASTS